MVSLNDSISINYLGDQVLITNPLYVKWSVKTLADIKSNKADLKTDLGRIIANKDNLNIISYLSTLLRAVQLDGV